MLVQIAQRIFMILLQLAPFHPEQLSEQHSWSYHQCLGGLGDGQKSAENRSSTYTICCTYIEVKQATHLHV